MKSTKVDYKKELETASKGMIMIHDPKLLIKLIVRMIVGKVQVRHAGMILYEPHKDAYVLSISRGEVGYKIPAGFAKFDLFNIFIAWAKTEYRAIFVLLSVDKIGITIIKCNPRDLQQIILHGILHRVIQVIT